MSKEELEAELEAALELLKRCQAWFDWPTPTEPGPEPAVCLSNDIDDLLKRQRNIRQQTSHVAEQLTEE